jgi:NAD(P)-dependent dehydrogenase (short-subunit alcohol dehydrogenase family)
MTVFLSVTPRLGGQDAGLDDRRFDSVSDRMARILITGSADGRGQMAAQRLVASDHEVVLHARNPDRARQAREAVPGARDLVVGDLSSIAETRAVAEQANALGPFDAVIHNAGVGYRESRVETVDGLEHVFAINVLAPYLLTALIHRPHRLIYLSSGMHRGGDPSLADLQWRQRRWNGSQAYSDSKLFDVVLAFAVARRWPGVRSNALEPGWVPTKMGGPGAPDDMAAAPETQVWLAVSDDPHATVSGCYFYHKRLRDTHPAASDDHVQDGLLQACEQLTRVTLPPAS